MLLGICECTTTVNSDSTNLIAARSGGMVTSGSSCCWWLQEEMVGWVICVDDTTTAPRPYFISVRIHHVTVVVIVLAVAAFKFEGEISGAQQGIPIFKSFARREIISPVTLPTNTN